jgi:hypothetical protein
MTWERFAFLLFGLISTWSLINQVLQRRFARLQKIDSPRSLMTKLEDLEFELIEFKNAHKREMTELNRKASEVPNHLQSRMGELELHIATRLANLTTIAETSKGIHDRYDRQIESLQGRMSTVEGRLEGVHLHAREND